MGAEVRDTEWADAAQSRLRTSLQSASAGTRVSEADCRQTLCKLDIVHDTPAAAQAFQKIVGDPETRPWDGEVVLARTNSEIEAAGAEHVVMFISRKGSTMRMN